MSDQDFDDLSPDDLATAAGGKTGTYGLGPAGTTYQVPEGSPLAGSPFLYQGPSTLDRAQHAINTRDYGAQYQIANEIRDASNYHPLTPDQRAAAELIKGTPQDDAVVQLQAYWKGETPQVSTSVGPIDMKGGVVVTDKVALGWGAGPDGHGTFLATTAAVEQKGEATMNGYGAKETVYTQNTEKIALTGHAPGTGGEDPTSTSYGVKVEGALPGSAFGLDFNSKSGPVLYGKEEVSLPNGWGKLGVEGSTSFFTALDVGATNWSARNAAGEAISSDRVYNAADTVFHLFGAQSPRDQYNAALATEFSQSLANAQPGSPAGDVSNPVPGILVVGMHDTPAEPAAVPGISVGEAPAGLTPSNAAPPDPFTTFAPGPEATFEPSPVPGTSIGEAPAGVTPSGIAAPDPFTSFTPAPEIPSFDATPVSLPVAPDPTPVPGIAVSDPGGFSAPSFDGGGYGGDF